MFEITLHDDAFVPDAGALPIFAVQVCDVIKLVPCSVMVLPTYPAPGATELHVGAATTVTALVLVVTTTVAGLLITSWTPALPTLVDAPITTTIFVLDAIVHDDARAPDAGVGPTRALHA